MPNIQLVSDLHLEHSGIKELLDSWVVLSDTLLMSGDIVPVVMIKGKSGQCRLIREFFHFVSANYKNVFWVMGNHCHWGNFLEHTNKNAQDRMKELKLNNIHILNNTTFTTPEFFIFGATLWTSMNNENPMTMMYCSSRMNDYGRIKTVDQWLEYRYIRVEDTVMLHKRSVEKLKSFIETESELPKIVMTHHLPSYRSIPTWYKQDQLSAAYASDLDDLIYDSDIKLYVHGHTHEPQDYWINKTRVMCNPRGYFGMETIAYNYKPIAITV